MGRNTGDAMTIATAEHNLTMQDGTNMADMERMMSQVTQEMKRKIPYSVYVDKYWRDRLGNAIWQLGHYSVGDGKFYDVENGNDAEMIEKIGNSLRNEMKSRESRYNRLSNNHGNIIGQIEMKFEDLAFTGFV